MLANSDMRSSTFYDSFERDYTNAAQYGYDRHYSNKSSRGYGTQQSQQSQHPRRNRLHNINFTQLFAINNQFAIQCERAGQEIVFDINGINTTRLVITRLLSFTTKTISSNQLYSSSEDELYRLNDTDDINNTIKKSYVDSQPILPNEKGSYDVQDIQTGESVIKVYKRQPQSQQALGLKRVGWAAKHTKQLQNLLDASKISANAGYRQAVALFFVAYETYDPTSGKIVLKPVQSNANMKKRSVMTEDEVIEYICSLVDPRGDGCVEIDIETVRRLLPSIPKHCEPSEQGQWDASRVTVVNKHLYFNLLKLLTQGGSHNNDVQNAKCLKNLKKAVMTEIDGNDNDNSLESNIRFLSWLFNSNEVELSGIVYICSFGRSRSDRCVSEALWACKPKNKNIISTLRKLGQNEYFGLPVSFRREKDVNVFVGFHSYFRMISNSWYFDPYASLFGNLSLKRVVNANRRIVFAPGTMDAVRSWSSLPCAMKLLKSSRNFSAFENNLARYQKDSFGSFNNKFWDNYSWDNTSFLSGSSGSRSRSNSIGSIGSSSTSRCNSATVSPTLSPTLCSTVAPSDLDSFDLSFELPSTSLFGIGSRSIDSVQSAQSSQSSFNTLTPTRSLESVQSVQSSQSTFSILSTLSTNSTVSTVSVGQIESKSVDSLREMSGLLSAIKTRKEKGIRKEMVRLLNILKNMRSNKSFLSSDLMFMWLAFSLGKNGMDSATNSDNKLYVFRWIVYKTFGIENSNAACFFLRVLMEWWNDIEEGNINVEKLMNKCSIYS